MLLRAGQSPFEPRLVTVADGPQTGREPHPQGVGSREKNAEITLEIHSHAALMCVTPRQLRCHRVARRVEGGYT